MAYVQNDQPPGVPPLPLTGERTLPDVPEENYWFQRHIVVYRWIAKRVAGQRVVDLGSGEGYGADLLAQHAAQVTGIEANPEAYEHARLRYRRPNLKFRRTLIEEFRDPLDVVVLLQTIEHMQDPEALVAHLAEVAPVAYISTPNRLTLAPEGAEKSGNPWHIREYTAAEYRELLEPAFSSVEILGLFHARRLRVHGLAIKAGWDSVHPRLGITKPFYDRFVPALSERDFALRSTNLDRALDFVAVCRR
ncbi:MAG: class I SAM-dependent methyltransferase [Solirubrobacterales bacterium]